MSLEVRDAAQPPLGPKIISSSFSNNGVMIIVNFDVDTDRMGMFAPFNCSLLMSFLESSSSSCTWTSLSSLSISLSTAALLSALHVNSELILLSGKLRAACNPDIVISCINYYSNELATVKISAPPKAIVPSVSLSMFSEVFSCNGLVIDATGSYGSCGRRWRDIHWSVSSDSQINEASKLERHLNSNHSDISTPAHALVAEGNYLISLRLTNMFGKSSIASKRVNVIPTVQKPLVSINGKSIININRPDTLSLSALASVIVCNVELTIGLVYSWKVYEGIQIIPLSSSSVDPRYFKVGQTLISTYALLLTFICLYYLYYSVVALHPQAKYGIHLPSYCC